MTFKHIVLVFAVFIVGASCWVKGIDPICPYPSNEITYFPFPGNCNKYIECYAGIRYNMSCPPDLFWNEYTSQCDYTCNGTSPTPSPDNQCPATGISYLPNYADCTKFYLCHSGQIMPESCPDGYAWNIVISACDKREQVDCSYTTVNPPKTTTPAPSPDNLCPATGISYLPNYADCTKFYLCQRGQKIPESCPESYAWNIVISACDKKDQVDCSYTTVNPPQTTTSAPRPDNQCPSTGTSYLPNYGDCTKFYRCNNGQKSSESCPNGYAWNIIISACDTKNQVDCSYTTGSPDVTTSKPPPDGSCQGLADGTLIPYPYDCKKFIECAFQRAVVFDCPLSTSWNNETKQCDTNTDSNCKTEVL